jgi:hypothetical protein
VRWRRSGTAVADRTTRARALGIGRRLLERKHPPAQEPDACQHANQERPRPQSDAIVERVAEEHDDAEHQRQVEGGDDQARNGEAG